MMRKLVAIFGSPELYTTGDAVSSEVPDRPLCSCATPRAPELSVFEEQQS
jgi:hypothetical protein